jgi:hypothetical protein
LRYTCVFIGVVCFVIIKDRFESSQVSVFSSPRIHVHVHVPPLIRLAWLRGHPDPETSLRNDRSAPIHSYYPE